MTQSKFPIVRDHCYVIIFPDAAACTRAMRWLGVVCAILIIVEEHIIQIKLPLSRRKLNRVIRRERVTNFKVYKIDDFEIEDNRTDEEKINTILEKINKYGLENITLEDRLLLEKLSQSV